MTDGFGGFFDEATKGSGPSAPGFDFKGQSKDGIGLSVHGEIVDIYDGFITDIDDPAKFVTDKNGKKQRQLSVTLKTELRDYAGAKKQLLDEDGNVIPDEGLRRVYLRYQSARAVGEAIQAAGATFDDFKPGIGAQLYLKRIPNPDPKGKMMCFEAKFKKGTGAAPQEFFEQSAAPAAPPSTPAPAASNDDPWGSPSTEEPPF